MVAMRSPPIESGYRVWLHGIAVLPASRAWTPRIDTAARFQRLAHCDVRVGAGLAPARGQDTPDGHDAGEGEKGAAAADRGAHASIVSPSAPLGGSSRPRYSSNAACMMLSTAGASSIQALRTVTLKPPLSATVCSAHRHTPTRAPPIAEPRPPA